MGGFHLKSPHVSPDVISYRETRLLAVFLKCHEPRQVKPRHRREPAEQIPQPELEELSPRPPLSPTTHLLPSAERASKPQLSGISVHFTFSLAPMCATVSTKVYAPRNMSVFCLFGRLNWWPTEMKSKCLYDNLYHGKVKKGWTKWCWDRSCWKPEMAWRWDSQDLILIGVVGEGKERN